MKIQPSFVLSVALLVSFKSVCDEEHWTMAPTKNVTLSSDVLQRNIRLQVGLPSDYESSDAPYSVVYCLDGFAIGGTLRETVQWLHAGNEMPQVVTVSIDLEVNTGAEWFKERSFILTPTKSDTYKLFGTPESWTGGGALFLKAIEEEIIPYVDKNYRTLLGQRTLVGHSFGGLFSAYVLFESPNLFDRYLISSPSLPWDDRVIFKLESRFAKTHSDLPAKVFLSVGAMENEPGDMMVDDLQELIDTVRLRKYTGLEMSSIVFANESHFSVPPVAFSRGLRVLYSDTNEKVRNLTR